MLDSSLDRRTLGVLIVGLGGAVATTAVAGIEAIRSQNADRVGLPLADLATDELTPYENIRFAGWDLNGATLAEAARQHNVLDGEQLRALEPAMSALRPWPAVGTTAFCANVDGTNRTPARGHRAAVAQIVEDIRRYRADAAIDDVVMINLASVERWPDLSSEVLQTLAGFKRGLDGDHADIGPAMLYAYAAIAEGVPYGNFTPSLAGDVPALREFATARNVPIAGKDGKTGQTMLKTVLAPALRQRALHVEGWFSTNILGNRDGLALDDPASLESKLRTKGSVLDTILGYHVEDHAVHIHYYKPRGDNKEAWDNIDVIGFMGQKMQIKIDFLCRDSILAAPLVIEIARVLDAASRRGEGGVQEQLGVFFKAPMTIEGEPEHAFEAQARRLNTWLEARPALVAAR